MSYDPYRQAWLEDWPAIDPNVTGGLYFAYGANLDTKGMSFRCKDAEPLCRAVIRDWRLTFRGCADIEPHPGASVHGALWQISKDDEINLDMFEGAPYFYRKERLRVGTYAQLGVPEAMVYIMNPSPYDDFSLPSQGYFDTLLQGYEHFDLPMPALNAALDRVITRVGEIELEPHGTKRLVPKRKRKKGGKVNPITNATRADWENGLVEDRREFLEDDTAFDDSYDDVPICPECYADVDHLGECDVCGWSPRKYEGMSPATRALYEAEERQIQETLDRVAPRISAEPAEAPRDKLNRLRQRVANKKRMHVEGVDTEGCVFYYDGVMHEMAQALLDGSQ